MTAVACSCGMQGKRPVKEHLAGYNQTRCLQDGDGEKEPATNGSSNGIGGREAAGQPGEAAGAAAAASATAARKLGKDPSANTDFLPDREREAAEAAVRAQLKKEYELRQKVGQNAVLCTPPPA